MASHYEALPFSYPICLTVSTRRIKEVLLQRKAVFQQHKPEDPILKTQEADDRSLGINVDSRGQKWSCVLVWLS